MDILNALAVTVVIFNALDVAISNHHDHLDVVILHTMWLPAMQWTLFF
jgi:hypothetical protein